MQIDHRVLTPGAHHATDGRIADIASLQTLAGHGRSVVANNPFPRNVSKTALFMGTCVTFYISRCNKQRRL